MDTRKQPLDRMVKEESPDRDIPLSPLAFPTIKRSPGSSPVPEAVLPKRHQVVPQALTFINTEYYPHQLITNKQAMQFNLNRRPKPLDLLVAAVAAAKPVEPEGCIVHWFRNDLRVHDNKPLSEAYTMARDNNLPLVCLYVYSAQDFDAHRVLPVKLDFTLRTLTCLKETLAALNVPLHVLTVPDRTEVPEAVEAFVHSVGASHLWATIEYEVDELRRDVAVMKRAAKASPAFAFNPLHDSCLVAPGVLFTKAGTLYSVFTPWYKTWARHLEQNPSLLKLSEPLKPLANSPSPPKPLGRFEVSTTIPLAHAAKRLSPPEQKRMTEMWPCGEEVAMARLAAFYKTKISAYASKRDVPSFANTSRVSHFFAVGSLSARTVVRLAAEQNKGHVVTGDPGVVCYIKEVGWRDFYRHVLANWPYVCMYKPFKFDFDGIPWLTNTQHFNLWCEGKTGYPIVDAAMRELKATGSMHNRARMIAASFLVKHLLIDWRVGERYFMENLIDGDFASNNGGWGWCSSVGVDAQPYFRIFSPLRQSVRFDPDGEYIRQWVPELRHVMGTAIHEPYAKVKREPGSDAYPMPIVNHAECRERTLEAYKA